MSAATNPPASAPARRRRLAALRRFSRSRSAVVGAVGLALLVAVALLAPVVAPFDPAAQDGEPLLGPSARTCSAPTSSAATSCRA